MNSVGAGPFGSAGQMPKRTPDAVLRTCAGLVVAPGSSPPRAIVAIGTERQRQSGTRIAGAGRDIVASRFTFKGEFGHCRKEIGSIGSGGPDAVRVRVAQR